MVTNQTALITGASSGIGYELAKLFAKDKYSLVIVSRNEQTLQSAAQEFKQLGAPQVTVIAKDLSLHGTPDEIYQETKQKGIEVNVLVNDAGVGEKGLFAKTDLAKELSLIHLNVISLVHLTKLYLRDMLARGEGKILQLASIAAYQPTPKLAVYAATKSFVLSFTDSLIHELKDTNITVTALIPGPTDTDFFNKAGAADTVAAHKADDPAKVAKYGYEGLMKGKHHAAAGPGVQAQVAMSVAMPNEAVTAMAAKYMEEDKKR